jgi:hypothetical protein
MNIPIPQIDDKHPCLGAKFLPPDHPKMQRRLFLAKYLPEVLPAPPATIDWASKIQHWPMHLNDQIGDCAVAGPYHQWEAWRVYATGTEVDPDDQYVVNDYGSITGYNGSEQTDQGATLIEVMDYWRNPGLYGGTDRIYAYVAIDPQDIEMVKRGVYLFGSLNMGIRCTDQMIQLASSGGVWDANNCGTPSQGGGHCTPICAYTQTGLTLVTWGRTQKATWSWWSEFVMECYAVLGVSWVSSGIAPNGFRYDKLTQDLQVVTSD